MTDVRSDVTSLLAGSALFSGLGPEALRTIAQSVQHIRIAGGDTLMREGDPGDCAYVVGHGRLRAFVTDRPGHERALAEIGRGETVGEMALLTGAPRSATVRAVRDTALVRFSKEAFEALIEQNPRTMLAIARLIVTRLQDANHGARSATGAARVIAVIPAGVGAGASRAVSRVAAMLSDELSARAPTLRVTEDIMASAIDAGEEDAWLEEQEGIYRFLVCEADGTSDTWTRRCIRQADRVLLVASANGNSELNAIESEMQREESLARRELVLVNDAKSSRPSGTAAWRASRTVAAHHHVRAESRSDVARLARRLTGRAVGVVLSGGGARGFSHIGALRALTEAGVPVDTVGGTSMGAVIGALFACGLAPEEIVEQCRRGFITAKADREFTFPMVALVTAGRMGDVLKEMFGDTRIEDLMTDYFCVAANITRASVRVAREGPLWKWTKASCLAPGIAPPMFENGELLVDGGVLDNFPVGIMRSVSDGPVIAMDVSAATDLSTTVPYTDALSGWRLLWQRISPFATPADIPNITEILLRTATLSSARSEAAVRAQVDLYIHPPVDKFAMNQWRALPEIVAAGYEHAHRVIGAWRETPAGRDVGA